MTALSEPTGEFNQTAHAVVKLAVARALHAFDALLLLADRGYATPALAVARTLIARTLIEETVASWWIRDLQNTNSSNDSLPTSRAMHCYSRRTAITPITFRF